jgi:hypothetical protein
MINSLLKVIALVSLVGVMLGTLVWSRYVSQYIVKARKDRRTPKLSEAAESVPVNVRAFLCLSFALFLICVLIGVFLKK